MITLGVKENTMDDEQEFDLDFEYDPYAEYGEYDEDLASMADEDQHDWAFYDSLAVSEY